MRLRALIADDEPLARERLRFLLAGDEEIESRVNAAMAKRS
jgi:DNA-binding LytR/AlgR family response regulator